MQNEFTSVHKINVNVNQTCGVYRILTNSNKGKGAKRDVETRHGRMKSIGVLSMLWQRVSGELGIR